MQDLEEVLPWRETGFAGWRESLEDGSFVSWRMAADCIEDEGSPMTVLLFLLCLSLCPPRASLLDLSLDGVGSW